MRGQRRLTDYREHTTVMQDFHKGGGYGGWTENRWEPPYLPCNFAVPKTALNINALLFFKPQQIGAYDIHKF